MREFTTQEIEGRGMTSQRTRDRLAATLKGMGIEETIVLERIRHVPRHLFVDEAMATRAYENNALPIGHGQTISQPYIVARMTALLLQNKPSLGKVLEVGTGSGYQAAVLSGFVRELHTVERIEPLHRQAKQVLSGLRYNNVHTYLSDGSWGLAKQAPYDAIMATAAPEHVPPSLLEQLAVGGCLVIPVGGQQSAQQLQQIIKRGDQDYQVINHDMVQFVPFISGTI